MLFPLLSWLIFFAMCVTVKPQSPSCDQSPYLFPLGELTNNNAINRFYSISTDSPVTNAIRSDPHLSNLIDPLYDLFDKFTTIIETRQRDSNPLACNLPNSLSYISQSAKGVKRRQIGDFGTRDSLKCNSRVDVDVAVQKQELTEEEREKAYNTLGAGLEALFQAARRIDVIPTGPKSNWTEGAFRTFSKVSVQTEQECTLNSLFAYRKNNQYYIRASLTNARVGVFKEDYNRQVINEYVPREGTTSLKSPQLKYLTDCEFETSTTVLTRWGGPGGDAHGGVTVDLENRFGVLHVASRAHSTAVDIAEDSLTGSNIAILALPMVMNFIPVAFIADLNSFAMLSYVIFTDVFSTLPFLIKGIELITTGSGVRRAMGSYHIGNSTLGQMEIFSAECRGKESYKVLGIVFVTVATVLMIVGVWLEIYARRLVQRRRRKGEEEGPFGEMLDYVGYGPIGGHTEDEKMRRFTYDIMMEEGIGARDRSSGYCDTSESSMLSLPSRVSNSLFWTGRDSASSHRGRRRNSDRTSNQSKKE